MRSINCFGRADAIILQAWRGKQRPASSMGSSRIQNSFRSAAHKLAEPGRSRNLTASNKPISLNSCNCTCQLSSNER